MAAITKENRLKMISEIVSQTAERIALEEIQRFEKEFSNAHLDSDARDLISQRAVSELMFRTCNFKCPEEIEEDVFRSAFDAWLQSEEEGQLRNMCYVMSKTEYEKRRVPGDENMTFTDRFLKKYHEEGKKLSTVSLLKEFRD